MIQLLLRRIAGGVLTVLAVATLIFTSLEVVPGDIATRALGRFSTEEQRAHFREEFGLNRPAHVRYAEWLGGVVQGDFGVSIISGRDVARQIVLPKAKNTLLLAVFAYVLYVPLSLLIATLAAVHRERLFDNIASVINLFGISFPDFVLGTIFIFTFAVKLKWLPPFSNIEAAKASSLKDVFLVLIMPAVTLAFYMSAYAVRMLRDTLIEVLDSAYVRMAVLKGLPRKWVVLRHALPNALLPTLNVNALNLAYLLGGAVIVERVFAYDGLGTLVLAAIAERDFPVIEMVILLLSSVYILANLFADLMAIVLTPRLRDS